MAFEIARNRELYAHADTGIALLPPRSARCVGAARVLYARILDRIEAADHDGDKPRAQELRDALRGEIAGMMGALQFQEITTQQLAYAASVLTDMEGRLLTIAKLFDPTGAAARRAPGGPDPRTFDRGATTRNADRRQAVADEVFLGAR